MLIEETERLLEKLTELRAKVAHPSLAADRQFQTHLRLMSSTVALVEFVAQRDGLQLLNSIDSRSRESLCVLLALFPPAPSDTLERGHFFEKIQKWVQLVTNYGKRLVLRFLM